MEYTIGENEQVSEVVVRAASVAVGREPTSLGPLADVLDPVALDALFERRSDGRTRVGGRVSFVYGGCRIVVESGEYLTLERLGAAPGGGRDPGTGGGRDR